MSYSELKAFDKDGNVICLEEFRNSHYLTVIWDRLAAKYGIIEKMKTEVAREEGLSCHERDRTARENKSIDCQAKYKIMENMQPVWDLHLLPEIEEDDRWCLMFTFDNAIVPPEHIERVAQAFERFDIARPGAVDHGASFAACMRKAVKNIEGIRGIALYGTSICDDPWESVAIPIDACPGCGGPIAVDEGGDPVCDNKECEENWIENPRRPYNLDKDDKHWFIQPREERKEEP